MAGWLGAARAEEIADALLDGKPGKTFACHETVEFDEDSDGECEYNPTGENEQHCIGAILLVQREDAPNQMLQIAERFGLLDPARINPSANELIFSTREEFVKHHAASYS